MATDLILACHGQAVQRDGDRLYGWWADMPLSPHGQWQALLIGDRLKNDFDVRAIYTSPLKRARQTAELIGDVVKVVPKAEHALRELDSGELAKLSYEEAQARFPDVIHNPEGRRLPKGEAYADMHRRVAWAVDRIVRQSSDQHIVCVTHGGPIVAYLRAFMGYEPDETDKPRFLCRVASLHHLQIDADGSHTVVTLNDVAHLNGLPTEQ